jgi:ATP-dependent DNA ligase
MRHAQICLRALHSEPRNHGPGRERLAARGKTRWIPTDPPKGRAARSPVTRNGHDWTDKYPLIVEAALRNRCTSFVIDGEAVLLGVDGRSDFDGLHSRKHNDEVQFYAFDILVADGEDVRKLPLSMRKTNLSRLFARRVDGIFLSDFEQGEIGPDLFRHACLMGLEGLVSKHKDRPYRAGRSPHWVKMKNPKHPAMTRVQDAHR